MEKKYLSIRHWEYWYGVYGMEEGPDWAEFSLYNDAEKQDFFFHFEIMNQRAFKQLTEDATEDEQVGLKKFYETVVAGKEQYRSIFHFCNDKGDVFYHCIGMKSQERLTPQVLAMVTEDILLNMFLKPYEVEILEVPTATETFDSYYSKMQ